MNITQVVSGIKFDFGKTLIISTFLSIILVGSVSATPSLDLGAASGKPCEQVTISIILTNESGEKVAATSNDVEYAPNQFTFVDCTIGPSGTASGKSVFCSEPSSGVVKVGVFSISDLSPIPDGIVASLKFEIRCDAKTGVYKLSNNPSCSSPQGDAIDADGGDGSIEVTGDYTTSTTSITPVIVTTTIAPRSTTTTTGQRTTTSTVRPTPTTTPSTSTSTIKPPPATTSSTSSTSTTSKSLFWPMCYDKMWGDREDENLFILRAFRDEVLLNTEVGREYTFMLYDNSLEVVILLLQDPSLTTQTGKVVDELLMSIKSLLYNDKMIVNRDTVKNVDSLLDHFEAKASPKLKTTIRKVRNEIVSGEVFERLRIIVK